jgi:hypothetical protein
MLEVLATVRPATREGGDPLRTGSDLSVIVIPGTEAALRRVPPVHHRSLAFVVDVTAWGLDGIDAPEALARLAAQGWHASTFTSDPASIAAAWHAAIDEATLTALR